MTDRPSRRAFRAGGGEPGATGAALPFLSFGDSPPGLGLSRAHAAAADNASRAANADAAMQKYFYVTDRKLYRENYPAASTDLPFSYLWAFEEAAKATLYLYGMPSAASTYATDLQARLDGREAYWDGGNVARGYRSYPQTGDRYYDDNDWVGSDLLQHHLLTGNTVALDRAKAVFSYVETGWTMNLPNRGGVRWVDASFNGDRGTGSTGGAAKLAAHLYDATRTKSYLDWALKAYGWTTRYLLAPDNGLYWDNMRADGNIGRNQWIYNQGVLIGANVLLYRVTGDVSYLTAARRLADAALLFSSSKFTDRYYSSPPASAGKGAYPGRGIFNAIFFRNLLMLHAVQPTYVPPSGVSYLQRMQAYADAAWDDPGVHDTATGLFKLNGDSRYSLLDQAGMVQVYAVLAWSSSNYGKLT